MGEGSVSFLNILIRFSYLAGVGDVVVRTTCGNQFSFYHVGPGELTQVPSLDGKCLYLLRHLSRPRKLIFSVSMENLDSAEGGLH